MRNKNMCDVVGDIEICFNYINGFINGCIEEGKDIPIFSIIPFGENEFGVKKFKN